MIKGIATKVYFLAYDTTDHTRKTGDAANLTAYVSKDGAAESPLADTSATEIDATNAPGVYVFDVAAGETNADALAFSCISTTGNIVCDAQFVYTDTGRLDRNAALIESQRGAHTWQGNLYYVDPVNGDTHANGNRGGRSDPYDSVQDCHDNAVTDSNHDVIILVAGAAAGVTTLTEQVTLSKRYLFIRGPGRDFIWDYDSNGDVITVTGDGIELSGFQGNTHSTGSGDFIQITGADFTRIQNCWINETQGWGVNILRGSNIQILNNTFHNTGKDNVTGGINIKGTAGNSDFNIIDGNTLEDITGDGIVVADGTTDDTIICNNIIHDVSGWGIDLQASAVDTVVHHNIFGNNTDGDLQDGGTRTIETNNEQWAKQSELGVAGAGLTATVDLVWDEVLSGATHNVANSSGRRLRQLADVVILDGTAQGPGTGTNQIQLAADASAVDGSYDPGLIYIAAGAGINQLNNVLEYDGDTKTATMERDWKVAVDNTSEYIIYASAGDGSVNEGLAMGGTSTSITLNALASSVDNLYIGQLVWIVSGVGADQAQRVTAYNGTTKVATVSGWVTTPTTQSGYRMLPFPTSNDVWDAATANHTTAGTFGLALPSGDLTAANANKIADHVLRRAWATAAASSDGDTKSFRSLLGAVAKLINKVAISGSTLTVNEADDSTPLGTQTLTTNASAEPVVAADTVE